MKGLGFWCLIRNKCPFWSREQGRQVSAIRVMPVICECDLLFLTMAPTIDFPTVVGHVVGNGISVPGWLQPAEAQEFSLPSFLPSLSLPASFLPFQSHCVLKVSKTGIQPHLLWGLGRGTSLAYAAGDSGVGLALPLKPGSVLSGDMHENKSLASSREEVQLGLYLSVRKDSLEFRDNEKGSLL